MKSRLWCLRNLGALCNQLHHKSCNSLTISGWRQDELVRNAVAQIVDLSPLWGKWDWRAGFRFCITLFIGCVLSLKSKKKIFFSAWTCIHGIDSGSLWVALLIFVSFIIWHTAWIPQPYRTGLKQNCHRAKPHLYSPAKSPFWDPILFSESLSPLLSLYLLIFECKLGEPLNTVGKVCEIRSAWILGRICLRISFIATLYIFTIHHSSLKGGWGCAQAPLWHQHGGRLTEGTWLNPDALLSPMDLNSASKCCDCCSSFSNLKIWTWRVTKVSLPLLVPGAPSGK